MGMRFLRKGAKMICTICGYDAYESGDNGHFCHSNMGSLPLIAPPIVSSLDKFMIKFQLDMNKLNEIIAKKKSDAFDATGI
jgi:hypothetical protein